MMEEIKTKGRGRPRSDVRRTLLIEAAFQLVAEVGFEGLRTRAVADRVGVDAATLHYYFPGKSDLVKGLLHYALERFKTVKAPPAEPSPYADILQEFLDMEFHLTQEPELFRVLNELQLHSSRNPDVHGWLVEMEQGWLQHLTQLIRHAQEEHRLIDSVGPEQIALEIIAFLRGTSLLFSSGFPAPSLADAGRRYLEALLPPQTPERNP